MTDAFPQRAARRAGLHRRTALSRQHVLRAIKLLLLAGGLSSLAVIVLWDNARVVDTGTGLDSLATTPSHLMSGARLDGTDIAGRHYTVTATQVFEEPGESRTVRLDQLRVRFFSGKRAITLAAGRGRYDVAAGRVAMTDGVRMETESGTVLETKTSEYFPDRGLVEGTDPVRVEGPWGILRAREFRYDTTSETLKFSGRPRLVLHSDSES